MWSKADFTALGQLVSFPLPASTPRYDGRCRYEKTSCRPQFLSENLKPITSVQNFVLRSISLTLSTTWPIFLILNG
jgi:hypothetical protein